MIAAYYNENDAFAAAWLRELIANKLIADGDVDQRSIEEVEQRDLEGYTQCHFFAGIGVWSYALRNAGWADDSPVWTGSCPCQSFSASGQRQGFDDKRHLWPAWFRLISECRPDVIFGEQVATKDGLAWFDVVSSDLERTGYAVGAADLCAAGVGAPHRRQRIFFVADSTDTRRDGEGKYRSGPPSFSARPEQCSQDGRLADAKSTGRRQIAEGRKHDGDRANTGRQETSSRLELGSEVCSVGDTHGERRQQERRGSSSDEAAHGRERWNEGEQDGNYVTTGSSEMCRLGNAEGSGREGQSLSTDRESPERTAETGFVGGFWHSAEWVYCNDPDGPKWRAVEPGSFPLVAGATARLGRLRGYGNSIVAPAAQAFIEAWLETR